MRAADPMTGLGTEPSWLGRLLDVAYLTFLMSAALFGFAFLLVSQHDMSVAWQFLRVFAALIALASATTAAIGVLFIARPGRVGTRTATSVAHRTTRPRRYGYLVVWAGIASCLSFGLFAFAFPVPPYVVGATPNLSTLQVITLAQIVPVGLIGAWVPVGVHLQRERHRRSSPVR